MEEKRFDSVGSYDFQQLKKQIDIIDFVSRFLGRKIKEVGGYFTGSCPLHLDKSNSFRLNPERQTWYCYSCHEGGDAIALYGRIHNIRAVEAYHEVKKKYIEGQDLRLAGEIDPSEFVAEILQGPTKKITFYITAPEQHMLNHMYAQSVASGRKKTKSDIICEGIRLIYKRFKEN